MRHFTLEKCESKQENGQRVQFILYFKRIIVQATLAASA